MAINRLLDALTEFEIKGLVTNRDFLIALLNDDKFQTGTYLTTYIDQEFLPDYLQQLRHNEKEAQVNGN